MTPPTFAECLFAAAGKPELLAEFDRLRGTHLATLDQRTPLAAMIDEATGRDRDAVLLFAAFVFEAIYLPLLRLEEAPDDRA